MKRILSLVLVFALLLIAVCGNVSAQNSTTTEISYDNAPEELIEIFEEAGYTVPHTATFSLAPLSYSSNTLATHTQSDDAALCMTTQNGNEITKTIILFVGKDEDDNLLVDNEATYLLRPQPRFTYPVTLSNKVRISGTATYSYTSKNSMAYYKPTSCSFSYARTATGSSSSVIYAGVSYYIKGNRYSNDAYSDHTINCTRNSPVEGTTYSNTGNPAPDYYVPIGGHILTYKCTVDGVYAEYPVSVTN